MGTGESLSLTPSILSRRKTEVVKTLPPVRRLHGGLADELSPGVVLDYNRSYEAVGALAVSGLGAGGSPGTVRRAGGPAITGIRTVNSVRRQLQ